MHEIDSLQNIILNTATLNTPIATLPAMSSTTRTISFTINSMATAGTLINFAEISDSDGGVDVDSNRDGNNGNGPGEPNDLTNDDETGGNGLAGGDEDDFDPASIQICVLPVLEVKDDTICRGNAVDLNTLVTSNTGDDLIFYTTLLDAQNGTNALISTTVSPTTATYFIKSVYNPEISGCEVIEKATIFIRAANCAGISVTGP